MIQIAPELLKALREIDFGIPGVDVRDAYFISDPTLPMLTLDELPGNDGVYLDNQPFIVTNIFTVEAYASQMVVREQAMTGKEIAYTLLDAADKLLNKQFGLTMNGNITAAPYQDQRVFRAVARYTAYIDTRNGTILRSI